MAVVVGLDGLDSIFLLRDAAAGVGDLDDIEELLADVGGDNEIAALSLAMTFVRRMASALSWALSVVWRLGSYTCSRVSMASWSRSQSKAS